MGAVVALALTQLGARLKQTSVLVATVALGVAILNVALALTNGFEGDITDRLLGTTPHVSLSDPLGGTLRDAEALARQAASRPGVVAAAPYLQGQGLAATTPTNAVGVILRGVDPAFERGTPSWKRFRQEGDLAPGGVVLGLEVARRLGVGVGERIVLLTGAARRVTLPVTGTYASGLYDYDAHVALVPLAEARKLMGLGREASGVAVYLARPFDADRLAADWTLDWGLAARPWTQTNQALLGAMALERVVIFLVVMCIVIVALVGVGSTMAMWVFEKRSEIALLRAMGLTSAGSGLLFVVQGVAIAAIGVVLGSVLGVLLAALLAVFPVPIAASVYPIDHLPVRVRWTDLLLVAIATLAVSPVAGLLPARKAMRLDPVAILRRG